MRDKMKGAVIALAVVAALAAGGVAVAAATGGDDSGDKAITGPALGKAKAAALAHTGGGRVTGTEVGDEEGYYEVEVTSDDGSQVDVHLDRNFNVLGAKSDDDSSGDSGADDGGSGDR
jgi:uncharacterized membrane protein YkoI